MRRRAGRPASKKARSGQPAALVAALSVAWLVPSVIACQDQHVAEPTQQQNRTSSAAQQPQETTRTTEQAAVAELVRHLHGHPDVTLRMTTGTEHFGKGLVELTIRGDGTVTIDNRAAGRSRSYTGKLAPDELGALGPELAAAGFTTLRSPGPPREPGDTPVLLQVEQDGEERHRAELWYGDRYQLPGLDRIIKRNDAIVTKLTDGALPY